VDGHPVHWKVYGRNKKSVTLNLKKETGRRALIELIGSAAVVIESFRPGYMEAMDLAPAKMLEINPKVIVVRVSGFGQTGPYAKRPGFGTLVEAMSGFAAMNGFPDREPVLPPLALADMVAALHGTTATMIALREIELKGGEGQVIDLSLLDAMVSILGPLAADYEISGRVRPRTGSASNGSSPRNVYLTADGHWIAMSGSTQRMTERIFTTVGRPDMIKQPHLATNAGRVENRSEVDAAVGGWIGERSLAECMRIFEAAGVTAAPVYDSSQMAHDPHFQERPVLTRRPDADLGSVLMHEVTTRLSRTPGAIRMPAPELGQHNAEILGALGYDDAAIAAMQ
jgi:formyl-CoA transferase